MLYPFSPSSDPFSPFVLTQDPIKTSPSRRPPIKNKNGDKQDTTHTPPRCYQHYLSLEDTSLLSSRSLLQMRPRPYPPFPDDNSSHPFQYDTPTTTTPSGNQQVQRLLQDRRMSHRRSCSDASIAMQCLRTSTLITSDAFEQQSSERLLSSLSQRNNKTLLTNPSVIKVPLALYKTEYCTKFREFGQCPFGERCQFVHHENELQRRGRALTYKTRVCWSGVNCQYQKNHSRCIYLHGDETAEMFDEQRGISFARVKKILAAKEIKQQNRRQQQQVEEKRQSFLLERSLSDECTVNLSVCVESALSREDSGKLLPQEVEQDAEADDATALYAPFMPVPRPQQRTLVQRPHSFPRTTSNIRSLTIEPPSDPILINNNNNSHNISDINTTSLTSTAYSLSDLFSPGIMPFIETPFPSHDRIHEWEDPCFEDEDSEDSGVDVINEGYHGPSSSSSLSFVSTIIFPRQHQW